MSCHHFEHLKPVPSASASYAKGCPECIALGDSWVHLRECLNKHATKHFHTSKHPVMRSVEPGEDWGWCYVDEVMVEMS
jgi:predicted dithiol-disulfide oxidoreductase (DUF899 family)